MSKGNTVLKVVGVIVLIIGLYYALVPQSVQVRYGLDLGLSHTLSVVGGIILAVIGIAILMTRKAKTENQNK